MAVTVIVGVLNNGNPALVAVYGLVAGLMFGGAALFVGNLLQSYIIDAATREAERRALEKELEKKLKEEARLENAQAAGQAKPAGRT
jgi:NAD/NADP transhydrogenase alpha subunit